MKRLNISFLLVVLMSMTGIQASAHDIEVANSQGKTIYYVWTNDNTELAVSYRGSDYWDYSDEYTGSVDIPATVTYGGQTYPVTSIGERAFASCSSLTSVSIPSSVTNIGEWAFASCSSLTSVAIEEGVTSIGESAFYFCSSLTSVTIPSSVTTIGEQAFFYSGLTSVTIPSSVTSIGRYAFYDCSSLTTVSMA